MGVKGGGPFYARVVPQIFTPTAQLSTSSTSLVMNGLAAASGGPVFTPVASGNVIVYVSCTVGTSTSAVRCNVQAAYGTGTPPNNGDAATGTIVGPSWPIVATNTSVQTSLAFAIVITGLTIGTAYWFDCQYSTSNSSDTAHIQTPVICVQELY